MRMIGSGATATPRKMQGWSGYPRTGRNRTRRVFLAADSAGRRPSIQCDESIARIRIWSRREDLNPRPAVYKTAALPTELRRHGAEIITSGRSDAIPSDRFRFRGRPRVPHLHQRGVADQDPPPRHHRPSVPTSAAAVSRLSPSPRYQSLCWRYCPHDAWHPIHG